MKFCTLIITLFFFHSSTAQVKSSPLENIPDFKIVNPSGDTVNIAQITKGKIAFINFWFIPCGPCMKEMSSLEMLYNTYKADDDFIFISITSSNPEAVRNMFTKSDSDTSMFPFFNKLSGIETVTFPVYTLSSCMDEVKKVRPYFYSFDLRQPMKQNCPYEVFKFTAYPTSIISDKTGKIIFNHTGMIMKGEMLNEIYRIIDKELK